jgi:regulator of protease activity HflC (stomatin/prohibitin superfamily)
VKKILLVMIALALGACSKVPAGNVGIKFYLLGGDKGADTEELGPGRYWIGVNEELYLFPTFTQNYTWTKEPIDGDAADESITFQTNQGLSVNADVGISYAVDPAKVTSLFQKYRKGIEEITDTYLRNMVRDALVTAASTREIEMVYGQGKAELLAEVESRVREQVDPLGIKIERLYWAGDFRLPPTVTAAIDAKIKATQFAQQRANEVAAAKAEADKAVEEARGVAESTLLKAKAEAEAIRIKGQALSENPRLVELSAVEKWDGKMPQFTGGGAVPFVTVPQGK